jgi:hypothetical protein
MTKRLSVDIENFNESMSNHKTLLISEVNNLNDEFTRSNDTYKKFVTDTEEKAS